MRGEIVHILHNTFTVSKFCDNLGHLFSNLTSYFLLMLIVHSDSCFSL
jgi:hypothetical protein